MDLPQQTHSDGHKNADSHGETPSGGSDEGGMSGRGILIGGSYPLWECLEWGAGEHHPTIGGGGGGRREPFWRWASLKAPHQPHYC